MGVPPYLIASSLECVVAQRLTRLCFHCRKKEQLTPDQMTKSELAFFASAAVEIYRAEGCRHCFGTGYSLSLIHISEPTRRTPISYAVFCLKKKKKNKKYLSPV